MAQKKRSNESDPLLMDNKDELTREIEQLAEAIGMNAEKLEEKVMERVDSVRGSIEMTGQAITAVAKAVVPTLLIRSNPWIATGSAVVGGFLIARKIVQDRKEQLRERDVYRLNTAAQNAFVGPMPVSGPMEAALAPQPTSFLQRHSGEVRMVRNLVLSALTRYAGKRLRTKLPQFSGQISLAEQAVSTLLR